MKRTAIARKPARNTGPSQKTRGLVLARDNWQCIGCGKPVGGGCTWWSIQHRVARGVGGGNDPSNLITLCASATSAGCHRDAENRTEESHEKGHWLRSDEDPRLVPVTIITEDGGMIRWLSDDGRYLAEAPAGAS